MVTLYKNGFIKELKDASALSFHTVEFVKRILVISV